MRVLDVADLARIMLIAEAAFSLGLVIVILYALSCTRRSAAPPPSLLTWHIVAISLAYLGLVGMTAIDRYLRLKHNLDMTWHIPAFFIFSTLGNFALWIILRVQVVRLRLAKEFEE